MLPQNHFEEFYFFCPQNSGNLLRNVNGDLLNKTIIHENNRFSNFIKVCLKHYSLKVILSFFFLLIIGYYRRHYRRGPK